MRSNMGCLADESSSKIVLTPPLLRQTRPFYLRITGIALTTTVGAMSMAWSAVGQVAINPVIKIENSEDIKPLELPENSFPTLNDVRSNSNSAPNLHPNLVISDSPHPIELQSWRATQYEYNSVNAVVPPPDLPRIPENLQPNPNQDRFPQPTPSPAPLPPDSQPPLQAPPTPSDPTAPGSLTIQVRKIQVIGSTIFRAEDFNPIVQPFEGRALTLEQLRQVADALTQLYLDRGYITSRAILVDQVISDGIVEIAIVEGSLEDIEIQGNRRVNSNYIKSRIRLGAGIPLNTSDLEDQLRLLRVNPLFENIEASLRGGSETGHSILSIRVVEANPFEGSFTIDNSSSPSVGSERLDLDLVYRNFTGYGDEITASYYFSTTGGSNVIDLGYRIPLNPQDGTLQLRTVLDRNQVTAEPVADLGIRGRSQAYEISFRQPLIRTPTEEFALSLGFSFRDGQTFLFNDIPTPFGIGPDENGITRTSVIKFGQDYVRRDARGAWAWRSLFSIGTGWFDATINPEPAPDGRFLSWLTQLQRVQILNEDNFLIVGADIQLTPNSLLPSQQFVIGGSESLRGYRQNARVGDNGVRLFIEDRITLERNQAGAPIFQVTPFLDAGWVWNHPDNPNSLPQERFLAGMGLGIIWQPLPGLSLQFDYALPLIEIEDREDNAQDRGFYFNIRYQF